MNRSRVALVLVPLTLLAGCGGRTTGATASPAPPATATASPAGTESPAPDGSSSPPASPQPPPTPGPGELKPPTGTERVEVERSPAAPPIVTGARFAEHEGFDRVVVDFEGELPGYRVEWVPELVQDGSGEPIDVKGGAYLQVTITPANAHTEAGAPTWTGGPVFQAGLGNVQNVVKTGDFEAVVGVGIVLDHKAGFRVLAQKQPNRLVIDVAH
ncbi:AMIN-like domain-containing (lipo)protein [Planomonospora venezuelensis]|uniref:AMIN-like domain-containing protein n=1 Tax=Planomonospora venezuelensis TaxID=1999 RepID=A0A841D1H0_PLAVE|nr:hypothetical protein [Planomonospora venezuelensis]MBB5962248.1 hypothetical protein [Planomonospora venezuelensis]GIN01014.1 hypothetical protein Pve01_26720 [Planomonospora venezuelensis]